MQPDASTTALPDLTITPVPAFNDNYLWLLSRNGQAAVVDPGDAAPIEAALAAAGLKLAAIVLTHHHRDHIGGVAALLAAGRQDIPVFGPAHEDIPHITQRLGQGDRICIEALGLELEVLDVPGHTAGHIAYFGRSADGPVLFCGDTLFATGCGRLFEGTPQQMLESLDRLAALPPETRVYCAHEYTLSNIAFARAVDPDNLDLQAWERVAKGLRAEGKPTVPTTICHEARTNPFLRSRADGVKQSAERFRPGAARDAVATFASIREWKNEFRG